MKKTALYIVMVALLCGFATESMAAQKRSVRSEISVLVSEYRLMPGFETVKIGSLGMSLLKRLATAALADEDPDAVAAMASIKGVKSLEVLDYEEAPARLKIQFNDRLSRILRPENLVLEAKDDGETVQIYGTLSEDGLKVSDFIFFAPQDCALICMFGTVNLAELSAVME